MVLSSYFRDSEHQERRPTLISYVNGDATEPQGDGPKIITHICNNIGGWGSGFVVAVSKKWLQPEAAYRAWYKGVQLQNPALGEIITTSGEFKLGEVQLVQVLPDTYVLNMIAQKGMGMLGDVPPIRYGELDKCLYKARFFAKLLHASVHMPRIGCGLAGGSWDKVETLVTKNFVDEGVSVTVYDL